MKKIIYIVLSIVVLILFFFQPFQKIYFENVRLNQKLRNYRLIKPIILKKKKLPKN